MQRDRFDRKTASNRLIRTTADHQATPNSCYLYEKVAVLVLLHTKDICLFAKAVNPTDK